LCRYGKNYFSSLLGEDFGTKLDEKGEYFIDRDGQYFQPILEYLRTGELNIPQDLSKKAIAREANYYDISIPLLSVRYTSTSHSPSPSPRSNGVYMCADDASSQFYVFGVDNKGFSNKDQLEFRWKIKFPLLELTYVAKGQVSYKEGVIHKDLKKVQLLWDDGNIFDNDGVKMEFFPIGSIMTGVLYSKVQSSLSISAKEFVSDIIFNTPYYNPHEEQPENKDEDEEGQASLLWESDGVKNWAGFSYKSGKFLQVDCIVVGFMWTSTKLEILPLNNMVLARKSASNNEITKFQQFVVVGK